MTLSPAVIAPQTKVELSSAAYRSSFIGMSSTTTPVTITQANLTANGGAVQEGDVVLCWVYSRFEFDSEDPQLQGYRQNLPAGFTTIEADSTFSNIGIEFGWKVAGASEGGYTAIGGDLVYFSEMIVVVVQSAAEPWRDHTRVRAFSTNTPYFPGIEPLSDGVVILMGTAVGELNTYTAPTGTTARSENAGGSFDGFYTRVMSYDLPTAGPTGNFVPASYSMVGSDTFFYTVAIQ